MVLKSCCAGVAQVKLRLQIGYCKAEMIALLAGPDGVDIDTVLRMRGDRRRVRRSGRIGIERGDAW
jgi:hypothetical protein